MKTVDRSGAASQRYDEVLNTASTFPDIPLEAIFKEDLLRLGVRFTTEALRLAASFKPKSYFIFSFDLAPLEALDADAKLHAPEEIALVGGLHSLKRTIVSVRLNPDSPYQVDAEGARLILHAGNQRLCDVLLGPNPEYYKHQLSSGKSMREVAPTIEWGYLVYLTAFRLCQYFGADEECQFCDINENFRQQRKDGRPYHQVKEIDDILEALQVIASAEEEAVKQEQEGVPSSEGPVLPLHRSTAYTITGGSITSQLQGMGEVEFYSRYIEAIESRRNRKLRQIQYDLEQEISGVQDRYKMYAILVPPIPPLLVALYVFFRRREAEREGIVKERLRSAATRGGATGQIPTNT